MEPSQKYQKPECLFSLRTTKMSENFHVSFTKGYIYVFFILGYQKENLTVVTHPLINKKRK